ncbi:hypothetical protein Pcinc_017020 [Petrolisthes cinctipes]|uniref:Uncharacterized protein n=1 Tax=Petrolisthes cinctipes TaxID=88211 RepID=A0AAE1KLA6_PETCI|nr:hypothetical protein Pcinc_017020 [Petrolisthes cinctipes]
MPDPSLPGTPGCPGRGSYGCCCFLGHPPQTWIQGLQCSGVLLRRGRSRRKKESDHSSKRRRHSSFSSKGSLWTDDILRLLTDMVSSLLAGNQPSNFLSVVPSQSVPPQVTCVVDILLEQLAPVPTVEPALSPAPSNMSEEDEPAVDSGTGVEFTSR